MGCDNSWSAGKECAKHIKLYITTSVIAIFSACLISLSIPVTYTSRTKISIDSNDKNPLEKGSLISNISSALTSSKSNVLTEPLIYEDILESATFYESLKNISVKPAEKARTMPYDAYLRQHHQSAWWDRLTRADGIDDIMERCIKYEVNTRNGMITIQVSDQNPYIGSLMVDSITVRIQKVMEKYMIQKAVTNYNNWKELRNRTGKEYKEASRRYADFIDSNANLTQPSTKINSEQLQAEVYRTMAVYQEAASRCKVAEMQIQRTRPLFMKIVNNTVPLNPSNPKWIQNIAIWLFYSIIGTTLFILYRRKYFSDSIKENNE